MGKMVYIEKEIEFDAGHRVPNHKSKCRNPHGHRYRVVVSLKGEIVTEKGSSDEGMLVDFSDLKMMMIDLIHDPLDHGFIVWRDDEILLNTFVHAREAWKIIEFPYVPTAENIAIWCWEQLESSVNRWWRGNLELFDVEVWETPTSAASYNGEDLDT